MVTSPISGGQFGIPRLSESATAAISGCGLAAQRGDQVLYAEVSFDHTADTAALIASGDGGSAAIGATSGHSYFTPHGVSSIIAWANPRHRGERHVCAGSVWKECRIGWRISSNDFYMLLVPSADRQGGFAGALHASGQGQADRAGLGADDRARWCALVILVSLLQPTTKSVGVAAGAGTLADL